MADRQAGFENQGRGGYRVFSFFHLFRVSSVFIGYLFFCFGRESLDFLFSGAQIVLERPPQGWDVGYVGGEKEKERWKVLARGAEKEGGLLG